MHEEHIDVSQVRGFALDEYLGLPLTHPEPYHSTIHRTVVEPLGLDPEKVHVPGDVLDGTPLGAGDKIAAAGHAYDAAIEAAGGIDVARAGHAVHGTTRQVLSLITNPMNVICRNIRTVREKMATRPDILGCHLEGPFLAPARAFGFDKASPVTGTPLGLIAPGYAADLNHLDPTDWTAQHVWCAGRQVE